MTTLAVASSNSVAPGTLGFLVVFGMAVVLFFLFRSMSKHMRKVNAAALREQEADPSKIHNGTADAASTRPGSAGSGHGRSES